MKNLEEINTVLKLIDYYSQKIGPWGTRLPESQFEDFRKKEALEKRLKELTDYLIEN